MKKHVEDNIINAFETWDNQGTDIGFDKDAVWSAIQNQSGKNEGFIWRKLAAVVIVLIAVSGMVYSFVRNQSLTQENNRLAAELQLRIDSVEYLKNNVKTNIVTHVKTDTVIQFVAPKVVNETKSANEKALEYKNKELAHELQRVHQLLQQRNNLCALLNDSVKILMASLQSLPANNTDSKDIVERELSSIDEGEYLAMIKDVSKQESTKETKAYKPRFKIVLFNNSDKSTADNEAPRRQGTIRF